MCSEPNSHHSRILQRHCKKLPPPPLFQRAGNLRLEWLYSCHACMRLGPVSTCYWFQNHPTKTQPCNLVHFMGNEMLKSFSEPTARWAQHRRENTCLLPLQNWARHQITPWPQRMSHWYSSTQPRKQETRPLTQPQLSDVALKHINHRDTSLIKILPCSTSQSLSHERPKLWLKRNTCLNKISHSYNPASPWLSNSSR